MMKSRAASGLLLFALFAAAGAAAAAEKERIVSLTPGATEILFALGLEEKIVGVSTACDFPGAARRKEKIGQFGRPDVEKVLSLRPDLILGVGVLGSPEVESLKRLGRPVVIFNPGNLEELIQTIRETGVLTGREEEAERIAGGMEKRVLAVKEEVKERKRRRRPRVYVEIWDDPLITFGAGSFIDGMIKTAGGENIAHDLGQAYSTISAEAVIRRNPDRIILIHHLDSPEESVKRISRRLGWEKVRAVRTGKVFADIKADLILRPSPRIVEGLEALYERIQER